MDDMTGEKPSIILARIDERQQSFMEQLKVISSRLELTYNQTALTNGRVTSLERDHVSIKSSLKDLDENLGKLDTHVTELNNWRSWLGGMWKTILVVAAVAGFIISTALHFVK